MSLDRPEELEFTFNTIQNPRQMFQLQRHQAAFAIPIAGYGHRHLDGAIRRQLGIITDVHGITFHGREQSRQNGAAHDDPPDGPSVATDIIGGVIEIEIVTCSVHRRSRAKPWKSAVRNRPDATPARRRSFCSNYLQRNPASNVRPRAQFASSNLASTASLGRPSLPKRLASLSRFNATHFLQQLDRAALQPRS